MTGAEQITELRAALEALVKLHKDLDKGTAYVTVKFMHDNNAAIVAARDELRRTEHATPAAKTAVGAPSTGICAAQPVVMVEVVGNGAVFARVTDHGRSVLPKGIHQFTAQPVQGRRDALLTTLRDALIKHGLSYTEMRDFLFWTDLEGSGT